MTVALRVLYSGAAAVMSLFLRVDPALVRSNALTEEIAPSASGITRIVLSVWERFDTLWYLHIARAGYDRPESVVFYPLYPALIRLLSPLTSSPLAAGLLVSTAATFFLLLGIVKLARLDGDADRGVRAALVCAVWPASFVLVAGYPESLVAALTVWAVYFARSGRWASAGLAGLFAGFAKAVGVVSAVPLLFLAFRKGSRPVAFAALPLLAPLVVLGVVASLAGTSPASVYPTFWRTEVAFPWTTLHESIRQAFVGPDALVGLNLGALAVVVALVLVVRTRPEHTLFALAAACFFLMKKTDPLLQSTLRYLLCVYPVYLSLGEVLDTRLATALVALSMLGLNLVLLWHFLHWSLLI